jgi:hypothetical protein
MKRLQALFSVHKLRSLDYFLAFLIVVGIVIVLIFFSRKKSVVYIQTIDVPQQQQTSTAATYGWISNSIKKGDAAFGPTGNKDAEVVSVDNVDWGGQLRTARLKLKVNALYDRRTKQYRLRDSLLQVGSIISFDIQNTKYEGMITYVGETPDPPGSQYKYMKIVVRAYSVEPWLAETYKNPFVVTNSEGREIFRIVDAVIHPAENTVPSASGELVRSKDPFKKDVDITAKVYVRCQTGVCYFNEVLPIKIGLWIWTQSTTSIIEGTTRIMELQDWVDTGK